MAVVLVSSTPNRAIYTFAAADTFDFSAVNIAALTNGPLKDALNLTVGQVTDNAKAISAVITGEQFVGGGTGTPTLTTNVNVRILSQTAGAVPALVNATDSGASNTALITITGAATAGWFLVEQIYSSVR